jgi:hypothetical protein
VYRVYAQMDTAKLDKTNTGLGWKKLPSGNLT